MQESVISAEAQRRAFSEPTHCSAFQDTALLWGGLGCARGGGRGGWLRVLRGLAGSGSLELPRHRSPALLNVSCACKQLDQQKLEAIGFSLVLFS